jgi:hypothetical protein
MFLERLYETRLLSLCIRWRIKYKKWSESRQNRRIKNVLFGSSCDYYTVLVERRNRKEMGHIYLKATRLHEALNEHDAIKELGRFIGEHSIPCGSPCVNRIRG